MKWWPFKRKTEPTKSVWPNRVYARLGDVIVCCGQPPGENMHPIATFQKDIIFGEMMDNAHLGDWTQERPPLGVDGDHPSLKCKRCGAPFWQQGNHFHFKEGWR